MNHFRRRRVSARSSRSNNSIICVTARLIKPVERIDMKVSSTLAWAILASAVSASSSDACVGTLDRPRRPSANPAVTSPEVARLAFAKRLGLSQYHALGDVGNEILELLDHLPGASPQLFFHEDPRPFPRVLTIVEDVQNPEGGSLIPCSEEPSSLTRCRPSTVHESRDHLQDRRSSYVVRERKAFAQL